MDVENYSHKISTIKKDGQWFVRIERILGNNITEYVNDYELPICDKENKWDLFENTMAMIGKSIGIDSPAIREHFKIIEN